MTLALTEAETTAFAWLSRKRYAESDSERPRQRQIAPQRGAKWPFTAGISRRGVVTDDIFKSWENISIVDDASRPLSLSSMFFCLAVLKNAFSQTLRRARP